MKINTNFQNFKQDNLTDEEIEVIDKYINKFEKSEYENILYKDDNLNNIYNLSKFNENLINWYNLKKDSVILEIGANFGELTGYLSQNSKKVVTIEKSLSKCKAICKRYSNSFNIEVIAGEINEIKFNEKFDYIIIKDNPASIKYVKEYLNSDGKIIIITPNKFGITYFAGKKQKYGNFETICNQYNDIYSKNELEELILSEGYNKYKFYYPLPNLYMPTVIFSDEYLPNENDTKLIYNALYDSNDKIVFDEMRTLKQLVKNNQFQFFANAFFVEISICDDNIKQPKFVSFNNFRKSKYRLATKIYDKYVEKCATTEESSKHINDISTNIEKLNILNFKILDKKVGNDIQSEFIDKEKLDEIIVKNIKEGNLEKAYKYIDDWYCHLKSHLTMADKINEKFDIDSSEVKKLTIVKDGFLDLVFENTFFIDNEFVFFDQEWFMENIPLECILYRAINNMFIYNNEIQNVVSFDEVLSKYNILQYKDIFEKIEKYINADVMDSEMQNIVCKSSRSLIDVNGLCKQVESFIEENDRKDKLIKEFENENMKKQAYINTLENEDRKKHEYIKYLEVEIQRKDEIISSYEKR